MSEGEGTDGVDPDRAPGRGLLALGLLALAAGALAGLVGAAFRLALAQADQLRNALVAAAHGFGWQGAALVVLGCAAAAALAAGLVRRFSPQASGSGIPHVEAVLRGAAFPAPIGLIAVKFVGGLLAIGSGLALGREGPSVQMGASLAFFLGRTFRRPWQDCRALMAAGAGAGLATAFNAPIAGAVFVLEELVQRFEHRIAMAALAASATAIGVARLMIGDAPDFIVSALPHGDAGARPLYFVFGLFAGVLGVLYNRVLLAGLAAARRLGRWPAELRAALVGAAIGAVAWFLPDLVGGGDAITQRVLSGVTPAAVVPAAFLIRIVMGSASYAAGTPGGLFAPMLVVGAQFGLMSGAVCHALLPAVAVSPEALAAVGIAALFAAVVRAPITGIVLTTEMTADVSLLLPMLSACATAMLTAALLGEPPIYESLATVAAADGSKPRPPP